MSAILSFLSFVFWLIVIAVAVFAVLALKGYNGLRLLSENVKEAWSNIGVSVRKQASLINQLISVVGSHAEGEKLVMLKVSEDASVGAVQQMHQQGGMMLSAVNGLAQRFPDLKSNTQYLSLMQSINEVENQLEQQRQGYNGATKKYNVQRTSIPHVFYSKLLGFGPAPYLDFDGASERDTGAMQNFASDDGERINQLLGKAGTAVREVTQQAGQVAVQQGRQAIGAAKARIEEARLARPAPVAAAGDDDATLVTRQVAAPVLVDIAGSAGGQRFTLKPEGQVIGRAATADIVVNDSQVSKQHAWVGQDNGRWWLRDQNSANGTYVNGNYEQRITEVELVAGLEVSLGHHQGTRFEVAVG